jgi:photosystem II stability/assembly factor-like uncharacterized protein
MHSNIRLVISFGIACVGCLTTALLAVPATAGTNSWTEIGQFGYPFAIDPSSPSTIYAANVHTVIKTTDGGATWGYLAVFAVDNVVSLVIDPRSPATIYAAMGPLWDEVDVPIYKSIDGGAHWAAEAAEFNGFPTSVVAIAPSLSSTLYAGEGSAVFKSIDGGLSWAVRSNGLTGVFVSALAIDPTNADVVYVAQQLAAPSGDPGPGQVFKSTDGGEQWRQIPISVPAEITSLAIDPSTPARIYAATDQGGVFKSIDSGETWLAAQDGMPDPIFLHALAIDPSTPARIYAATDHGVFMSTDAAASWTPINSGLTSLYVFGLSIDRSGSLLRAATAAGLFEYQIARSPSPGTVALIEYFHAIVGDYFITANQDEISQLDNGAFSGWARTGLQFNAYATFEWPSVPVCRFFSTGFSPKSTHFFTPFAAECAALRADSNWTLESASAFAIALPGSDGVCAAGLIPVYRFYDGNRSGVPNHRYTTDVTVRAQMMAQGWIPEGVGPNAVEMCSPQ